MYDRYGSDGLVVVGIHSPEFDFEKNHDNVQRAVKELGVTWPVALDDDMAIWNSFGNNYWPEEYLTDRDGKLRQVYIGEGEYDQKEDDVRTLLGDPVECAEGGDRRFRSGPSRRRRLPRSTSGCRSARTQFFGSSEPLTTAPSTYTAPSPVPADKFALQRLVDGVGTGSRIRGTGRRDGARHTPRPR